MKRFWDNASVTGEAGALSVLLDGKPMRIPGGAPLVLASRALADAIAAEWQAAGGAKGGELTMDAVPLTRLAGTAQDRIAPDPRPVADALARYAETDLLCYRAAHPVQLVVRQARAWQPWLDWLEAAHGARLEPTEGIIHRKQDPVALARVQAVMAAQSPATLAALGIAIPSLGSAVLGLALAEGALDAAEAHALASLDELFEVEAWGEDEEGRRRRELVAADLVIAERFLRPCGPAVIAKRLRIEGRVQGVGYRDWMARTAVKLLVAGWVRNDGRGWVEAHVEGDAAAVEELLRLCRRGPLAASVTLIHEDLVTPEALPGFERR